MTIVRTNADTGRPGIISISLEIHVTREFYMSIPRDIETASSCVCSHIVGAFTARMTCSERDENARYKFCGDALLCVCVSFDTHEQSATVGGGSMYSVLDFYFFLMHKSDIIPRLSHFSFKMIDTCRYVKVKLKSNKIEELWCKNFSWTFCVCKRLDKIETFLSSPVRFNPATHVLQTFRQESVIKRCWYVLGVKINK